MKIHHVLLGLSLCSSAVGDSAEYQQRYRELSASYHEQEAAQRIELLESFFGISPPDIGEPPLDREFFSGISDQGFATIISARSAELARIVEEMNCNKLSVAKLCQILLDRPDATAAFIAEQKASARELVLQRKLNRYNSVFESLSPQDQALVQQFNLIAFGQSMPAVAGFYRQIFALLAAEFPEEFREDQNTACLVERRDDQQLLLLPQQAAEWRDLGPMARCEKTKQYSRALMLVCPENFDPQDKDEACQTLLSPEDAILAESP